MIYLPNKFEIYCSLLRNTIQKLIIKRGLKQKYLIWLMKIHKAEAINEKNFEQVNCDDYFGELLKAVYFKKINYNKEFSYYIGKSGNLIINKKLATCLILTLAKITNKITIQLINEKIVLKANNICENYLAELINNAEIDYFYERKNNTILFLINTQKSNTHHKNNLMWWEYVSNPLSVVNIYLN